MLMCTETDEAENMLMQLKRVSSFTFYQIVSEVFICTSVLTVPPQLNGKQVQVKGTIQTKTLPELREMLLAYIQ